MYSPVAVVAAYEDLFLLAAMPVLRGDDIEKTLGVLPEDFERVFVARCRSLGIVNPLEALGAEWFPVRTAEDYVRLLSFAMNERKN